MIRNKTLCYIGIALAAFAFFSACQESNQVELEGGEVVKLRSQDGTAELFADDLKVVQIRTSSNARFIIIHSEDGSLFSLGFKKGDGQPFRVDRAVEIDGEIQIVSYDEKGDVIERVPIE